MADAAALVVALSAQLTNFQKDMESATKIADDSIKRIEDNFSKINPDASKIMQNFASSAEGPAKDAGTSIGSVFATAFGIAIGGTVARLFSIAEGLAKIGDRAEDLRLPVNLLQALSVAAESARLPQSDLNKALDQFTAVSKKSKDDAEEFYTALQNVGKGFDTAFEKAPTQEARLRLTLNAMHSTTDEAKRAQIAMTGFKLDSEAFFRVFGDGSEGLDKGIAQLEKLGLVIDESAVKRAQEARSQLSLLARVITDELSSSLAGLIPSLTTVLPFFEKLGSIARDLLLVFSSFQGEAPIDTVSTQLQTLQKQLTDLEAFRERLASGNLTEAETLRGKIAEVAGTAGFDITRTLESTDKEIKDLRDQINEVAALKLQLQQGGGAKITIPARPAFPPRPSLGGSEEESFFDRQTETIKRHIASLNADAAAVGLTAGAHAQLRAELALLTAAQRDGASITDAQIDQYAKLKTTQGEVAAQAFINKTLTAEQAEQFRSLSGRIKEAATSADQAQRAFRGINEAVQFAGNQMIDIMVGLTQKTLTASEAMRQLTNALIKALLQAALLGQGPLGNILGFGSNVPGGTGGLLGSLISGFKGSSATGIGGIGHAQQGGPIMAGRPYVVGEAGPELFIPKSAGNIVPSHVATKTSGSGTEIVINNYTSDTTEAKQQQSSEGPNGERLVIDIVKKAQSRGEFDSVNRGRFGIRPAKVR